MTKQKSGSEGRFGRNSGRGGGENTSVGVVKICVRCKGVHDLTHCDDFKKLTVGDKKAFVLKEKLCYNCLKFGHASRACTSTFKCFTCKGSHHTLLHRDQAV